MILSFPQLKIKAISCPRVLLWLMQPKDYQKKKKKCCWASGLLNLGISDWFRNGLFKKLKYAVHFWKKNWQVRRKSLTSTRVVEFVIFLLIAERIWVTTGVIILSLLGMYTMDRYFLVPAPNWVVTRVLLRFWTNGTVIGTLFFSFLLFLKMIFNWFLTWMDFLTSTQP